LVLVLCPSFRVRYSSPLLLILVRQLTPLLMPPVETVMRASQPGAKRPHQGHSSPSGATKRAKGFLGGASAEGNSTNLPTGRTRAGLTLLLRPYQVFPGNPSFAPLSLFLQDILMSIMVFVGSPRSSSGMGAPSGASRLDFLEACPPPTTTSFPLLPAIPGAPSQVGLLGVASTTMDEDAVASVLEVLTYL
jgi:hypothetical protein